MVFPNPDAGPPPFREQAAPRWGLGDAAVGWLISWLAAGIFASALIAAAGYSDDPDGVPLGLTAIANLPLWMGFLFVPMWAAATKGAGWIKDFHVSMVASDVPLGLAAGVLAQLILVPALAWPVLKLTGTTTEELERPAQELADKANGVGGWLLFALIVGLFAPVAEELFFRGLVLRSCENRWGTWWALAITSVVFGATHFQPVQFVPLVGAGAVFGLLAVRTDRLGPAIVAHMAFNMTTVVLLWTQS